MIDATEIERAAQSIPVLLSRLQEESDSIDIMMDRADSLLTRLIDITDSVMLMHARLSEIQHRSH